MPVSIWVEARHTAHSPGAMASTDHAARLATVFLGCHSASQTPAASTANSSAWYTNGFETSKTMQVQ